MADKTPPPVLIMVRPARRGYLVEVAGSDQDPYPCMSATDIGEAILEILEDPNREPIEYTPPTDPTSERFSSSPTPGAMVTRDPEPEPEPEGEEYEVEEEDDGYRPNGWDAGDELAMRLFGAVTDKARKISRWRSGGGE